MAVDEWTAEGGTNGTGLTTANTGGGSGAAFGSTTGGMSIGANNTMVFSNAQAMNGTYSVLVDRASGSTTAYAQRTLASATARHVARIYVRFAAFPAGNTGVMRFQNSSATNAASLFVDSAGKFVLQNAAGTAVFTATTALSINTWYRVEVAVAPGTTTSTGAAEMAYYAGHSTTAIQTMTPITTGNFGTVANINYVRVGRYDTSATTGGYYFDNFGNESKGSGLIGPYGVTPPTAGGTGLDNTYTFDARTLSLPGAAGALTWSVSYNTGQSLTVTEPVDGYFVFVKSAAGTAQYTLLVSETGGSSATMFIDVPQLVTGTITSYSPRFFIGTPGVPSQSWS